MSDDAETYVIRYRPAIPGDAPSPEEIRELRVRGTGHECGLAGMRLWDEESGLLLIPEAWVDALPDDILLESINGKTCTVGELRAEGNDGWKDTRFGLLAFGWRPRGGRDTP